MKYFLFIAIAITFSFNTYAKSVTLRRLDALEAKVIKLEEKINSLNKVKSQKDEISMHGLRVKDEGNKIIETSSHRSISSSDNKESLSDKKKKEIMNQLDTYKKKRAESQKILDEIMNENY